MRRLFRLLCLLFVVHAASAAASGIAPVLLVLSEDDGVHAEMATALRHALEGSASTEQLHWEALSATALKDRRVVVSIGGQAAQAVASASAPLPVLHTLVSRAAFARLPANPRASAIFLDQPVARQIALIRLALPEHRRLALLFSPASEAYSNEIASAARGARLQVSSARLDNEREIFRALQQVLGEPAVLLAIPDPAVYNSYTIQNILLTAYRQRSPLVGFSAAYARAGALLALYSTPGQLAEQAAAAVRSALLGGELPRPAAPQQFEVAVNSNVARSLGLRIDSAAALGNALRSREEAR